MLNIEFLIVSDYWSIYINSGSSKFIFLLLFSPTLKNPFPNITLRLLLQWIFKNHQVLTVVVYLLLEHTFYLIFRSLHLVIGLYSRSSWGTSKLYFLMSSLGQVITSCKVEAELIPSDKDNIAGGVVGVKDTSSAKDGIVFCQFICFLWNTEPIGIWGFNTSNS